MGGCQLLSEDQCSTILENYSNTNNFKINNFTVNPLKSQLDGLIGEQHIVKIHYQSDGEEHIAQFFLKTLNGSNPVMFELSKSIYAYEKESFYYETLVPLLQSKALDYKVAPKSYFCEPYIIVLEDLSLMSYTGTVKNQPLDLKHCKKSLETLAKFHVGPIIYEAEKIEELKKPYTLRDDFKEILEDKVFSEEVNGATKFMRCSIKGLFQLIELIPENGVSKSDLKSKLQNVLNDIMGSGEDPMGFRCTILHGDLWSNNFLYTYKNNEIEDCKLIDFQTVKYGPPALDLLQFIMTNTRRSFREEHIDELITYYYDYLTTLLSQEGLSVADVIPEGEFKNSCEVFAIPAKIQAVVDRSITFMADETYLEAAQSEESFLRFLFEERGSYIVNLFNTNQYFKELMIEDISELRDMLFADETAK